MSDSDAERSSSVHDPFAPTLFTDDANLSDALRRVAETGCGLMSRCACASVTIIEQGHAITVGSTSDVARTLDDAQYAAGDGPCLTAARTQEPVRIDDMAADGRWPDFSQRALEHDVHSSLSMPLHLAGHDTWGGFNVYNTETSGLSDEDQQLCRSFASHASIVVSNVQAYWASLALSENLIRAMQSRAFIEQAKGILMSTHRVGPDEAFDLLVERSQAENRKVRDVAADVVRGSADDERS